MGMQLTVSIANALAEAFGTASSDGGVAVQYYSTISKTGAPRRDDALCSSLTLWLPLLLH